VSRRRQQPSLWDAPDPAAERSRSTMWDVVRFAEQMAYDAIVVENVVEAARWVLWHPWLAAMDSLGYRHRVLSHNSMHHGVAQSRDRLYVVFWRTGLAPDLELELTAPCVRCRADRVVRQAWKNGRRIGRYRQQWYWACTTCGTPAEPSTRPAADILDWALPCPRVGDRSRPLAPATRARVLAGLQRHGWAPVVTAGAGNGYERTPGNRARPVHTEPMPTQRCSTSHALAAPPGFLLQTAHGGRLHDLDRPHPTVCASDDRLAFVVPLRRHAQAQPTSRPVPTVTAGGTHHALVMRNNTARGDQGQMVTPAHEPIRTITTTGHQSLLVLYNRTGRTHTVTVPSAPSRRLTAGPSSTPSARSMTAGSGCSNPTRSPRRWRSPLATSPPG
jgi:DNA (cytosine-5)-methyltransferase 1